MTLTFAQSLLLLLSPQSLGLLSQRFLLLLQFLLAQRLLPLKFLLTLDFVEPLLLSKGVLLFLDLLHRLFMCGQGCLLRLKLAPSIKAGAGRKRESACTRGGNQRPRPAAALLLLAVISFAGVPVMKRIDVALRYCIGSRRLAARQNRGLLLRVLK